MPTPSTLETSTGSFMPRKFGAEEAAEAADFAEHLGAVRDLDAVVDAALHAVAEVHIHAGGGVGFLGAGSFFRTRRASSGSGHFRAKSSGCSSPSASNFDAIQPPLHDEFVEVRIDRHRVLAVEAGEAKAEFLAWPVARTMPATSR